MRKFFALFLFAVSFGTVGSAFADPRITFTVYKCLVCDKQFQSFPGDPLDDKKFKDEKEQLKRVFRFGDRGKNLNQCKGSFKAHIFQKTGTNSTGLSGIANTGLSDITGVIRDGGSLSGIKLTEWECVYCKKHFYSLNDENLNIRDWEFQTQFLFNMKRQAIPKCPVDGTWGHVFIPKRTGSVKSYELATIAYDLYWVKN